ncbi:pentatricopeptide repeat-containing protein At4g02750-like [Selaginella moellendorffii]|uniref:pentatricopeptide repeat-containing protein At4g02750-like n=1 Tax=Selaginella moellendorffii TaxID=88036 RepID=UPI000D1C4000|nr:pentatricopeptide repeat-containing protein At4g02750-like [Selaginella moellendorffii]|eukprot:XP_024531407.1 pentatricopeptide repeat-containing protein At4g02750-like [Selaginella moellendorffii]
MPWVDLVACNAMIAGFVRNNEIDHAKRFFDKMKDRDVISWNSIVSAFAQNRDLQMSKMVFDRMAQTNIVSWNSIVSAYAQNGEIDRAYEIFHAMLEKDVVSWTAMIVANSQLGRSSEAFCLFQKMDLDGVAPNAFTFSSVIDACGSLPYRRAGKIIHEELISIGLCGEVNVENAFLSMYAKLRMFDLAKTKFDLMPRRDVVSWTSIAAAHAQSGDIDISLCVFSKSAQHDVVSWTSLIATFSSAGMIHDAEKLFDRTPVRNRVTWNTMITAYANNGFSLLALRLFKSMDLEGVRPDRVSFIIAIESCASIASLADGKLLHSLLLAEEQNPSSINMEVAITTSLIHLYGRCGSLDTARQIFDSITGGKDRVTWNAMLSTYAQSRRSYALAMDLFRSMAMEGVEADEITSVAVITACSHAGNLEHGRHCFACLVRDFGIRPVIDHYVCVMDVLGRVGLLDDAQDLFETMPFEGDEAAWLVFLSSCKLHGDVKRAILVATKAVVIGSATPATFVLLSNSFS